MGIGGHEICGLVMMFWGFDVWQWKGGGDLDDTRLSIVERCNLVAMDLSQCGMAHDERVKFV